MIKLDNEIYLRKFTASQIGIYNMVDAEVQRIHRQSPVERMLEWKSWHPECICDLQYLLYEDKHRGGCPLYKASQE